jgi:hypothetical protein
MSVATEIAVLKTRVSTLEKQAGKQALAIAALTARVKKLEPAPVVVKINLVSPKEV